MNGHSGSVFGGVVDGIDDDDLDRTMIGIEASNVGAEKSERDRPYLIVLAGPNLGQMYPVEGSESFVGRGASAVLTPRAHVRSLLGGMAPLDMTARGSFVALAVLVVVCGAIAVRRAGRAQWMLPRP